MGRKMDYNRGVMINQDPRSGVEVFMYTDTPGIYYNAHGTVVTDELAKAAGYDTEGNAKKKRLSERMAQAMEAIKKELQAEEVEGLRPAENIVLERNGFKLLDIGLGRHVVKDPDGNPLTPEPLTKELGTRLFDQLVPVVSEPQKPGKEPRATK